jgi:hypothetical protein
MAPTNDQRQALFTERLRREMDFPRRSAEERAAQYDREAQKFLKMAEAETVARIRAQLAALAEQYHELALSLRSARKIGR